MVTYPGPQMDVDLLGTLRLALLVPRCRSAEDTNKRYRYGYYRSICHDHALMYSTAHYTLLFNLSTASSNTVRPAALATHTESVFCQQNDQMQFPSSPATGHSPLTCGPTAGAAGPLLNAANTTSGAEYAGVPPAVLIGSCGKAEQPQAPAHPALLLRFMREPDVLRPGLLTAVLQLQLLLWSNARSGRLLLLLLARFRA